MSNSYIPFMGDQPQLVSGRLFSGPGKGTQLVKYDTPVYPQGGATIPGLHDAGCACKVGPYCLSPALANGMRCVRVIDVHTGRNLDSTYPSQVEADAATVYGTYMSMLQWPARYVPARSVNRTATGSFTLLTPVAATKMLIAGIHIRMSNNAFGFNSQITFNLTVSNGYDATSLLTPDIQWLGVGSRNSAGPAWEVEGDVFFVQQIDNVWRLVPILYADGGATIFTAGGTALTTKTSVVTMDIVSAAFGTDGIQIDAYPITAWTSSVHPQLRG